ncbi:glycosyltransferase [Streptosporangium saharense]|uniref:Glycosyltransferase n=1 Tax=Streptosporangium saharense TaxID=1706840 RepID=A0A7W7QIM9_9ACTN|nr:glycosyltransferase [Streptosporangium saharense]MBB4914290.1 glycosyltransferase [Streptosporangium saharense]
MRILFVAGGTSGVIFSIIPLAQAARNAGHEVVMAGPENVVSTITSAGLTAVAVTSRKMLDTLLYDDGERRPIPTDLHERYIFNGRCFGRYADWCLEGLLAFADHWRPDVVVGGTLVFAAPLVARHAGVPYVKQAVDMGEPRTIDLAAAAELGPWLRRLGFHEMPRSDLFVDVCPPSLREADAPPAQIMRYIPYSTKGRIESWMYTRGDRPRVLVSAGSRVTPDRDFEILSGLVAKVGALDVELFVAAPPDVAAALRPLPDNVRAGWLPLDVVAPTCDLVVSHAGGTTVLGNMHYGVPQLLIPYLPYAMGFTRRLTEYGAAKMLPPEDDSPENVAEACREVLGTPSYRQRARDVSQEMSRLPGPSQALAAVERLVHTSR